MRYSAFCACWQESAHELACGVAPEVGHKLTLDLLVPRLADDLCAGEVGHVEHVDGPLAEGRDMRRGDIEIEPIKRLGQFVEEADAVEPVDLDHGEAVGELLSMMTRGATVKALMRRLRPLGARHQIARS